MDINKIAQNSVLKNESLAEYLILKRHLSGNMFRHLKIIGLKDSNNSSIANFYDLVDALGITEEYRNYEVSYHGVNIIEKTKDDINAGNIIFSCHEDYSFYSRTFTELSISVMCEYRYNFNTFMNSFCNSKAKILTIGSEITFCLDALIFKPLIFANKYNNKKIPPGITSVGNYYKMSDCNDVILVHTPASNYA